MCMKSRLIVIYILSIVDLAFKLYLTHRFGDIEANPVGKLLLKDTLLAILYKVFVVGIALILLYHYRDNKLSQVMSWILLVVFICLVIYHIVLVGIVHYILFIS